MGRERIISSSEEMAALGKQFASHLSPNSILALSGDLGSGKTTFVKGLALGLGIQESVISPTFVYLNTYEGKLSLFHFDLYRLKSSSDFLGLGFEEYFEKGGICAIEWSERIVSLLPSRAIFLYFGHKGKKRVLTFSFDLLKLIGWD